MDLAYYDGSFLPLCDVKIGMDDRAFFFGDGVYDAMVGRGGKIHLEGEHLCRFRRSLLALSLEVARSDEEIHGILGSLLSAVDDGDAFLYIQANRARPERNHSCLYHHTAHLFAYAKSITLPDENKPLSLVTVEDTRYSLCHIKTVNLLPNVLASTYAERMGADEAVFVCDGVVRECSHSSISILLDGVLVTHPLDCHILPGVMRGELLRTALACGIAVKEDYYTLKELLRAEGVLVSSTTRRVQMAKSIDGIALPEPSELTKMLHKRLNLDFYEKMGKN